MGGKQIGKLLVFLLPPLIPYLLRAKTPAATTNHRHWPTHTPRHIRIGPLATPHSSMVPHFSLVNLSIDATHVHDIPPLPSITPMFQSILIDKFTHQPANCSHQTIGRKLNLVVVSDPFSDTNSLLEVYTTSDILDYFC